MQDPAAAAIDRDPSPARLITSSNTTLRDEKQVTRQIVTSACQTRQPRFPQWLAGWLAWLG